MDREPCPNRTLYRDIDPETWPGVLACECKPGSCPGADPEYPEPQPTDWRTINGLDVPIYSNGRPRW